jgi:hypothetical protein
MSDDETRNPDAGGEGVSDAADVAAESTSPAVDPSGNEAAAPSAPVVSGDEVTASNQANDDAADNVPA